VDERPIQSNRFNHKATHNRPIIRALRDGEKTPERLAGMTDAPVRFKPVEDISNSEEEVDMDMDTTDSNEVPTKRRKLDSSASMVATKWSNPDPYSSLPPVDEVRAKRTDVVQLIRKAKVDAAAETSALKNEIAENDDFVPLDFGSDNDDEDRHSDHPLNTIVGNGASGIPFDAKLRVPSYEDDVGSLKRKRPSSITGNVVSMWQPVSTSQATPWLTVDHSATEHMGFW
jgi:non-canonical poly(A) RNA polymerase PAPD5/7